jgi:hypothetical protein
MFKQHKQPEAAAQRRRTTLQPLSKTPSIDDVRLLLTEASAARGTLCEVQIRKPGAPVFVLTCQYDATASDPNWALYEGEDGSKVLWSYPNSNLEMVVEMICMAVPSDAADISALKPAPPPPEAHPGQPAPHGAPAPAGYGAPQPPYPQHPYPPQGYPQQPYPPQGYPQQPYPPQPAQGYPPQPYPQQGYPQAQPPYPPQPQQPGWGQQAPYPQQPAPYQQPQGGYPAAPGYAPPAPPAPGNTGEQIKPTDLAGFVDLLSKGAQANLMLGHLFVEAGVLPEPCLDAALKLQELVRKGTLSNEGAIEALRRSAESGGQLTDDIIATCRAMYPAEKVQAPTPNPNSGPQDPREAARQVILLIQQSGVVTENDVSTAEGVRRKHGGDVGNILVSAGKIEKATLDAARRCQPLVYQHKLNSDEVSRILQHCQKTRASVEDACRELSIRPL